MVIADVVITGVSQAGLFHAPGCLRHKGRLNARIGRRDRQGHIPFVEHGFRVKRWMLREEALHIFNGSLDSLYIASTDRLARRAAPRCFLTWMGYRSRASELTSSRVPVVTPVDAIVNMVLPSSERELTAGTSDR